MRNHLLKSIFISLILLLGVGNAWATYYYRGNQNSWGATPMTASADGFYEYFAAKSHANNGNQNQMFKVSTSSTSWNYNNSYMNSGFNGTNITNMGSWDGDNICMYHDKDYYILVYKPNTTVNNTSKPIVCAATYLPDNRECTVYFVNKDSWNKVNAYGWYFQKNTDGSNNGWPGKAMTNTGKTYNGKQIWSYTYPQTYDKAIFNNGSSKTSDLPLGTTNKGKMYDYPNSQWTAYTYDVKVTFNANGHGTAPTAKTVLKGEKVSAPTEPTAIGYTFGGWYKESGCTNAWNFTTDVVNEDITLYAKWTEKIYAVTISAGNGGTVSPSGSQTIGEVTQTTVTATANDNYEFVNWTATGGVVVANTSSASTTITATATGTLTANFRSTATNSLTVVAGANIESVAGSIDPVTLGKTYDIKATPKTGYTFSTWTADPAENATFGSATSANTTVTVNNGSVIVTASATEIISTLTTSNNYDAGNPGYAVPSATVSKIGIATTATVTATAAGNGYTFTGWTFTNCTRTDDGADNATSITVRSNGDGKAATVVANYAEDLTTSWVLKGSFVDDFATAYDFTKKSGESTGKVAYTTLELDAHKEYHFKVVKDDTWYGNSNNTDGEKWWIKQTTENWTFKSSDGGDCYMKSGLAGTYTFKIDYSGANPKVSVYFPEIYAIVGTFNEWNENTNKLTFDGNIGTATINLEASATNYEFKVIDNAVHGGVVDKTITQTENDLAITVGGGDNIKLTANANPKGNYIFTYDKSTKKLSVTYPAVYTITVEAENGTVEGAGTYVEGTTVSLTATPAEGYHFVKWSNESSTNPLTITVTEDIELQAIFDINTYTVTTTAENGKVTGTGEYTHGTEVTLTATPAFDYQFVKWSNESTENPLTITVTEDVTLEAIFEEVAATTTTLSGKFSTGKYEYAEFATGNLQHNPKSGDWRFAKQQYQYVGKDNIYVGKEDYKGWIDLFGWSADDKFGVNPSNDNTNYQGEFVDWGTLFPEEGWSTLSKNQWNYLLNERTNAASLKQIAMVGETLGIMLFPDEWTLPAGCAPTKQTHHDEEDGEDHSCDFVSYNYTLAQWTELEKAGAIFLPAAGRRTGGWGNKTISPHMIGKAELDADGHYKHYADYYAYYWTSTKTDGKVNYLINCTLVDKVKDTYTVHAGHVNWAEEARYGQSVRLAKVTSTAYTRTVTNGNYGTICLPYASSNYIGMELYEVSWLKEGTGLYLDQLAAGAQLVAGKPYIFKATATEITVTYTGTAVANPKAGTNGLTGTFEDIAANTDLVGHYIIAQNKIWLANDQNTLPANRAYIANTIPTTEQPKLAGRRRVCMGENAATGLDNITNGENTVIKTIENGQLIIIRDGIKYNALGVRF